MYGITMTPPLQLLKRKHDELESLMKSTSNHEIACNIKSLLLDYKEAIKKLEA